MHARNPWAGINAWRELLYDARHPARFLRRALDGARGQNPDVPGDVRIAGIGMVVVGLLMVAVGLYAALAA